MTSLAIAISTHIGDPVIHPPDAVTDVVTDAVTDVVTDVVTDLDPRW